MGLDLGWATPSEWVQRIASHEMDLLSDHAHCELKAAAMGQVLIAKNPEYPELAEALTPVVIEEMEHFALVVAELRSRGGELGEQLPSPYAEGLHRGSAMGRTSMLLDRLLIAHLIEGRSLERLHLLSRHHPDQGLRQLFGGLCANEAQHRALFLTLAQDIFGSGADERLLALTRVEAEILDSLPFEPRMHSGMGSENPLEVGQRTT